MTIAIIGAGVMGETVLAGIIRAGHDAGAILVGEKREDHAAHLRSTYGVQVVSNLEAAAADTVLLIVKPQDMSAVLAEVAPSLRAGQLLISLAAGITTARIAEQVPAGVAVVRVMPNTPALVSEGMSAISPGAGCTEEHLARTEELLAATGRVVRVPEEQQDAVTAVSGSGPAYVFLVAEALIDAGVALGLPREVASELTLQTLTGSAKLLRETGETPQDLRAKVTSPNGTTAAALATFESLDLRGTFAAATRAARDRSVELAGPTA